MLTQCPHCKTTFRLQLEQLKAAAGKVRCSRCDTTFDAIENLAEANSSTPPTAPSSVSDDSDTLDAFIEELTQSTSSTPPAASERPPHTTADSTTLQEDVISAAIESLDSLGGSGSNASGSSVPETPAQKGEEPSGWDIWFNNRGDNDIDSAEFDSDEEMTLPLVELEPKPPSKREEKEAETPRNKPAQGPDSRQLDKASASPQPPAVSPKPTPEKPATAKPVAGSKTRPSAAKAATTRQVSKAGNGKTKRATATTENRRQPKVAPADKAPKPPQQLDLYADSEHRPGSGDAKVDVAASVSEKKKAPSAAAANKPSQERRGGKPPRTNNQGKQADPKAKRATTTSESSKGTSSLPSNKDKVGDKAYTASKTPPQERDSATAAKTATPPSRELASSMLRSARQQNRPRKAQAGQAPTRSVPSIPAADSVEKPRQQPAAAPPPPAETTTGQVPQAQREKPREQKVSLYAPEELDLAIPTAESEATVQDEHAAAPLSPETSAGTTSTPEAIATNAAAQPPQEPTPAPEAEPEPKSEPEPLEEQVAEQETAPPPSAKAGGEGEGGVKSAPPVSYAMQPELTQPHHTSGLSNLLWVTGIILLCCTLLLQLIYYNRQQQANNPQLRPLLEIMCRLSHCQLPPRRDVSRIELVEHLMQYHPNYQNSLLLTATIANHADFDQPYPLLEVVMSNIEQQVVARRHFLPRQYLSEELDPEALFPANSEVPLLLEVVDPGNEAVGFEFRFH